MKTPIFIIGTGRCGSTILHQKISIHSSFSWPTPLSATRPRLHRMVLGNFETPLLGGFLKKRIHPQEAYSLWDRVYGGFARPCRDLTAEDVTPALRDKFDRVFAGVIPSRRDQLLLKITGWPRVAFLHAMFPDAKFIHVYRDGRAVVNSLMQTRFWRGWEGPANWRWGTLSEAQRAVWEASGKSFVTLGRIQWSTLMDAYRDTRGVLPASQYLEISYEELCESADSSYDRIFDFLGIERNNAFDRDVAEVPLVNQNHKWKRDLNPAQQNELQACLAGTLAEWGYDS